MNLDALRSIGYGMYVIGSKKGDRINAQIANTVFQITSEPPTIAVSINKQNLTHEFISESQVFSASVLCQDTPLSFVGQFGFRSGKDTEKLKGVKYKTDRTGAPVVLDNAVAYIEARVVKQLDVGSHTIFVGEVINADVLSHEACLTYDYYRQIKRGTTPKTAPSYVAEKTSPEKKAVSYRCLVCGYIYDPEKGDPDGQIKPGTPFEQLPAGWVCPICGADKSQFKAIEG